MYCKYEICVYLCIIIINDMKNIKISRSDFRIEFIGRGHWKVTYISPVTQKSWSSITNDSILIDEINNYANLNQRMLNELKSVAKSK